MFGPQGTLQGTVSPPSHVELSQKPAKCEHVHDILAFIALLSNELS